MLVHSNRELLIEQFALRGGSLVKLLMPSIDQLELGEGPAGLGSLSEGTCSFSAFLLFPDVTYRPTIHEISQATIIKTAIRLGILT